MLNPLETPWSESPVTMKCLRFKKKIKNWSKVTQLIQGSTGILIFY